MIYIESDSLDVTYNLALEQYIFEEMDGLEEYFMLWRNQNTVVIGRNQNTAQEINEEYVKNHNTRVVRRLSGGGAVYQDEGNLNFTYIVNGENADTIDLLHFCNPIVRGLQKLGLDANVNGRNDIEIDGKKFSGNSQYRKNGRIMHHGTILFDTDLDALTKVLNAGADKIKSKGVKSVRSRVTNIRNCLKEDMTMEEFLKYLLTALSEEVKMEVYELNEWDKKRIQEIQKERYQNWEWNYGQSPQYQINKERRIDNCGNIQVHMNVENSRISQVVFRGDYFGNRETEDISRLLCGCKIDGPSIVNKLSGVELGQYFVNLKAVELADIIVG